MLSILTVNIGAAATARAGELLRWLAARPEDVFLLTETSNGSGTTYLLDRFRQAGYAIVHSPDANGDRGTALERPGDYVVWGPGIDHIWQAEADSVVITVRWPSLIE